MHLFFDTVWKLHIGEIPEKPEHDILKLNTWVAQRNYDLAIAAIKQNALTVGNPEVIKSKLDSLEWVGRIDKADVYKWPGGYETKEIQDIVNWDYPVSTITGTSVLTRKTIAILTLPEEKKNTMENNEIKDKLKKMEEHLYNISRGSVAAPKPDEDELQHEWERGYKIGKHESDNDIQLLHESMINLIAIATEVTLNYGPNSERRVGIEKAISRAKALLDKQ